MMPQRLPTLMIALAFVSAIASSSRAQVITTYPTDHAGIVALHDRELKELKENNKAQESDDLVAILNQMPELILQHPALTATKAGIYNYASVFQRYIKKQSPSSKVFSEKLQPVQDALSKTVSPFFQGMFDTDVARTLSERDDFPSLAASLAASGVSLYDQAFCLKQAQYTEEVHEVALENQAHHALPFTYHPEDGEQLCSQEIASRYALLGTIQAKAGNTDGAKVAFQAAIAKHANRDAYLGLAEIDEAEANLVDASEMFTEAYLTGTLTPTMIQKAKDAYTKAHPGSTLSDYERALHDTYAKNFVNLVNGAAAPPVPSPSTHVVLEELFTGSDCEPCVAPDLATDAILSRYNRNQVVVVVYHDNAPGPDPLTTDTSVVRHNYYDTHGSTPHVFLDGKEIEVEEGSPAHAQSSFDILTRDMDVLLKKRPLATLHLKAEEHGGKINVIVTGQVKALPQKASLQLLLVQTEVDYSGSNTLRLQPMVVRASGWRTGETSGKALFQRATISQHYTFDIPTVEADDLAYYDNFTKDSKEKLMPLVSGGYLTQEQGERMFQFREHKNTLDGDRLAVVAFVQDDKTKSVLESLYAPVTVIP